MGIVQRTVEIDADLLAVADAQGVDINAELEAAIRRRLSAAWSLTASAERQRTDPDAAAERARQWAEENAEGIEAYNERIDDRGVFGDEFRRW
jgi:post-segregation antitoxin (ccd killing protein)